MKCIVTSLITALVGLSAVSASPVAGTSTPALPAGLTTIQAPNAAYGLSIKYVDSKYYVDSPATFTDGQGLAKRGTCYGLAIGSGCCIGVYCGMKRDLLEGETLELRAADQDTVPALPPVEYNVKVEDGYTLTSLVIHPDGTYDAALLGPDGLTTRATCIGVRIGDCCVGICVL
jgi:hypothetical protein